MPAPTKGAVAKRPRDRKRTIVAAAAELFARKGFAAVGLDDIGAAVGVSGPAIYRHFPNKEALLIEVVVSNLTYVADALDTARDEGIDRDPHAITRVGVSAILDRSAGLATATREFRRLIEIGGFQDWATIQRRIDHSWRAVIRKVNPDLDRTAIAIRMAAMLGPYLAVTIGSTGIVRPHLDDVCAASLDAILRSSHHPAGDKAPKPGWRPPPIRREVIRREAIRLFARFGFAGVGVSEIGEAAGISGPTLYHYYPSKAAILVDAIELAGRRIAVRTDDALAAAASADDALYQLTRAYAQLVFDDVDLITVTGLEADQLADEDTIPAERAKIDARDRWVAVLQEARPGLSESNAVLLVRMVFPLIDCAVFISRAPVERIEDIASVAVAHLLS